MNPLERVHISAESTDFSTLKGGCHASVKILYYFQPVDWNDIFSSLTSITCKSACFLTNPKDTVETQGELPLLDILLTELSTESGDTFFLACPNESE